MLKKLINNVDCDLQKVYEKFYQSKIANFSFIVNAEFSGEYGVGIMSY